MVNKALLEYIENSLKKGVRKAQIMEALYKTGWQPEEIISAFNQIKLPEKKKPLVYIFSALLIIMIVIGFISILLGDKQPKINTTVETTTTGDTTTTQETTISTSTIITDEIEDCSNNILCMITAAKECKKAKLSVNGTIDLARIPATANLIYEILGPTEEGCALEINQLGSIISEEDLKFLRETVPEEEIVAMQQELESTAGISTCYFENQSLVDLFTKWSRQEFSTEDYSQGSCTGAMFP